MLRAGVVGDSRKHFTKEMEIKMNEKILKPLQQLGLTFDEYLLLYYIAELTVS